MKKIVFTLFITLNIALNTLSANSDIRVPAEWEEQEAIWMQWPREYEANMRKAFSDIIAVIQKYESLHLLVHSESDKLSAKSFLSSQGVLESNITWHIVSLDNAWMRDSGPIYIENDSKMQILNWGFNGWDKKLEADYYYDNLVPKRVGEILNLEVLDYTNYILEKGNIEFNGDGVALLNWDCQNERNPNMSKSEHESILKSAMGLKTIIWAYGYDPSDITTGHIDGIARFVSKDRVVVTEFAGTMKETEDNLIIALKNAGFETIRYESDPNWLVGNGFVLGMGEGNSEDDNYFKSKLQEIWSVYDVYMIDAKTISDSGGGIHCVTNDQPKLNRTLSSNSKTLTFEKDWNLAGAVESITDMKKFDKDCISKLWSYRDKKWSEYSNGSGELSSINQGQGYWIKADSDNCQIDLE